MIEMDDPRIASQPDGYMATDTALADLDEAERLRYLYAERRRLRAYEARKDYCADLVPVLRAAIHDDVIRQTASARRTNGTKPPVVWDDIERTKPDEVK